MTVFERACEFLRDRGAHLVSHPGGTLLAHLERTRDLLSSFAGALWTPPHALASQLAELTAANELDLCLHGSLTPVTRSKVVAYVHSLRPLLSSTCREAISALV